MTTTGPAVMNFFSRRSTHSPSSAADSPEYSPCFFLFSITFAPTVFPPVRIHQIVFFNRFPVRPHHAYRDRFQPDPLKAHDNLADERPLHRVRLDDNQCFLNMVPHTYTIPPLYHIGPVTKTGVSFVIMTVCSK